MTNHQQSEHSLNALDVCDLLVGIMSILACLAIFVQCVGNNKFYWKSFAFETKSMVLFLAFSDFALALLSIIEILAPECVTETGCAIFSFARQVVTISSFFWTACICDSSYKSLSEHFSPWTRVASSSRGYGLNPEKRMMIRYHYICWGAPVVLALLKEITQTCTQSDNVRCGMQLDFGSNFYRQSLFWVTMFGYIIPIYVVTLYVLFVLLYLARKIRQASLNSAFAVRFQRLLLVLIATKVLFAVTCSLGSTRSSISYSMWQVGPCFQGVGDFFVYAFGRHKLTHYSALARRLLGMMGLGWWCCGGEGGGANDENTSGHGHSHRGGSGGRGARGNQFDRFVDLSGSSHHALDVASSHSSVDLIDTHLHHYSRTNNNHNDDSNERGGGGGGGGGVENPLHGQGHASPSKQHHPRSPLPSSATAIMSNITSLMGLGLSGTAAPMELPSPKSGNQSQRSLLRSHDTYRNLEEGLEEGEDEGGGGDNSEQPSPDPDNDNNEDGDGDGTVEIELAQELMPSHPPVSHPHHLHHPHNIPPLLPPPPSALSASQQSHGQSSVKLRQTPTSNFSPSPTAAASPSRILHKSNNTTPVGRNTFTIVSSDPDPEEDRQSDEMESESQPESNPFDSGVECIDFDQINDFPDESGGDSGPNCRDL